MSRKKLLGLFRLDMQPILKGGYTMVNIEELTSTQIEDLSFTDVERKELERKRFLL